MKANNPSPLTPKMTSEQLDALLHAPASEESSAEVAQLRALFTDLRDASTTAAQTQFSRASVVPVRRTALGFWALGAAAIALCVTPFAIHHRTPGVAPVVVADVTHAPNAISDEALFADVQSDLDAAVPSPMLPLTADSTSTSTQSSTTKDK